MASSITFFSIRAICLFIVAILVNFYKPGNGDVCDEDECEKSTLCFAIRVIYFFSTALGDCPLV
jgi:hypothetical protein